MKNASLRDADNLWNYADKADFIEYVRCLELSQCLKAGKVSLADDSMKKLMKLNFKEAIGTNWDVKKTVKKVSQWKFFTLVF